MNDTATIPQTTHNLEGTAEYHSPESAVAYARRCAFAVNKDARGRWTAARDDMSQVEFHLRQQAYKRNNVQGITYYWRRVELARTTWR